MANIISGEKNYTTLIAKHVQQRAYVDEMLIDPKLKKAGELLERLLNFQQDLDRIIQESNGATIVIDFAKPPKQCVRITATLESDSKHRIKSGCGHTLAEAVRDYLENSDNG